MRKKQTKKGAKYLYLLTQAGHKPLNPNFTSYFANFYSATFLRFHSTSCHFSYWPPLRSNVQLQKRTSNSNMKGNLKGSDKKGWYIN
jgi:hypothetical protein